MLAGKTVGGSEPISGSDPAEELQIRHHSTVGLVDELFARNFVVRESTRDGRRGVLLQLTELGNAKPAQVAPSRREELLKLRGGLIAALGGLGY